VDALTDVTGQGALEVMERQYKVEEKKVD